MEAKYFTLGIDAYYPPPVGLQERGGEIGGTDNVATQHPQGEGAGE